MWQVLGTLELFFRAPVGCNAYLTPPGRQGFAPHSDDIDAFILQLEGTKRWVLKNYRFEYWGLRPPAHGICTKAAIMARVVHP